MRRAFQDIKDSFKSARILSPPDVSQPYILTTDACATGIGATLTQLQQGQQVTIAFYSKKLSPAEAAYSATELETLAIANALSHFGAYLHGAHTNIVTDYRPLTYIDRVVNSNKRLMRLANAIQQFPHSITYLPGKDNTVPDALSRTWDDQEGRLFQEGGDVGFSPGPSLEDPCSSPTTEAG